MINLLKADFRRYSRTKLLYIVALINLVLALFTILFTYWFVDESLLGEFTQGGYGYFLTALNPSNNGGLLIGIIISASFPKSFPTGQFEIKLSSAIADRTFISAFFYPVLSWQLFSS